MLIKSIDVTRMLRMIGAGDLAGVGCGAIAANTPNLVFDAIQARVRIPLISIARRLRDDAAIEGLILGGTELPLILDGASHVGVPLLERGGRTERLRRRPSSWPAGAGMVADAPDRSSADIVRGAVRTSVEGGGGEPLASVEEASGQRLSGGLSTFMLGETVLALMRARQPSPHSAGLGSSRARISSTRAPVHEVRSE